MKSTIFFVLLAIAGTVSSANVTSTTKKPTAGAKKSTSTAKVTVPTIRPPVLPVPSLFPPQFQNWAPQPFPQQFTQPHFQQQPQFSFQSFASEQPSAFQQAPQQHFAQQSWFPSFFGQPPSFQQQQFTQPSSGQQSAFQQQQLPQSSFNQQPRVSLQPASSSNFAANTNVFSNLPQSNFFAPVQSNPAQFTAPQRHSSTSQAPSNQQFTPATPQRQSQQQGVSTTQTQFSFPGFQPFQQRANPQPLQQQSAIPNPTFNAQPFFGFQQWQPMAAPLAATKQPFPGFLSQQLNPITTGSQTFEQSDSQAVNSFTPQQSSFASFAPPESASWNLLPSNSFSQQQFQQPQVQQPQFTPSMRFPQPNSVFA